MNKSERDLLAHAVWAKDKMNWGVFTNSTYRKSVAKKLVARGWLVPSELMVCDDDGFSVEPERYRDGYELTNAGRMAHEAESRPGYGNIGPWLFDAESGAFELTMGGPYAYVYRAFVPDWGWNACHRGWIANGETHTFWGATAEAIRWLRSKAAEDRS
jgi:hypothetical protein